MISPETRSGRQTPGRGRRSGNPPARSVANRRGPDSRCGRGRPGRRLRGGWGGRNTDGPAAGHPRSRSAVIGSPGCPSWRKAPELAEQLLTQQAKLAVRQEIKEFRPQLQTLSLPSPSGKVAHQEKQNLPKLPLIDLVDQRAPPMKHLLASGL